MSLPSNAIHAISHDMYPEDFLPPLWKLIYHEGVRGHHLLFSASDLQRFRFISDNLSTESLKNASTTIDSILQQPDLKSMAKVIAAQPFECRFGIFVLYQRTLSHWNHQLKTKLH